MTGETADADVCSDLENFWLLTHIFFANKKRRMRENWRDRLFKRGKG